MSHAEKTKDQLLVELDMLRQRIDQLEMAEDGLREAFPKQCRIIDGNGTPDGSICHDQPPLLGPSQIGR